nr:MULTISPECIES: hypothetical protein [Pseudomonas]
MIEFVIQALRDHSEITVFLAIALGVLLGRVRIPPAAQWAFSEFGLTAFGAVVGLLAGPAAFTAVKEQGLDRLVAGALVTLIPPLVTLYFGRYILRLHPLILFGALAGVQTETASMNKIIEQSGSNTPVIGFTVCYAISNVLLAVCGPIIIAFTSVS